jgi:hypothetical protein
VAGVIGYMAAISMPEATAPSAIASLPFMTTWSPRSLGMVGISDRKSRCSLAQRTPRSRSAQFLSTIFWLLVRKAWAICSLTRSTSRSNIQLRSPRANMFLPLRAFSTSVRQISSMGTGMMR